MNNEQDNFTQKYNPENFKKPTQKFLTSKWTRLFAFIIPIIVGVYLLFFNPTVVKDMWGFIKRIVAISGNIEILDLTILLVVLGLIFSIFMSYYLLRGTYLETFSSTKAVTLKERFNRVVAWVSYRIAHVYIVVIEFAGAGTLFLIGFYYGLPSEETAAKNSMLIYLLKPTIFGAIALVVGCIIINWILERVFTYYYGGLWTFNELKWNNLFTDGVSHIFFIFSLIGSIISMINGNLDVADQTTFFAVYTFSIAFYILKILKNLKITFFELNLKKK